MSTVLIYIVLAVALGSMLFAGVVVVIVIARMIMGHQSRPHSGTGGSGTASGGCGAGPSGDGGSGHSCGGGGSSCGGCGGSG